MGERGHHSGRIGRVLRLLAELVVLCLLGGAVAASHWNLGSRWFGWTSPDPATHPGQVAPPPGLKLPAAASAVRVAATAPDGTLDRARIAAAVAPYLRVKRLGKQVGVYVGPLDPASPAQAVTYSSGPTSVTPASTTKLLTSLAALDVLGPQHTFATSVVRGGGPRRIVLVGGGDPLLAKAPVTGGTALTDYPHRADLTTLARATAAKLKAAGVHQVRLGYDASLFTGPSVDPNWPSTYIPEAVVPPITALWADEGASPTGVGYSSDPAATAAADFRDALRAAGIRVPAAPVAQKAAAGAEQVAEVRSAPLSQIVQHTLLVSDNNAAEVLGHQVGLAVAHQGSFSGGVTGVTSTLRRLGVPMAGTTLYDGSGLSRRDLIAGTTLLGVLRTAADPARPRLRAVITGLPVAGFVGSLAHRFDDGAAYARGRVHAKTGTLTGVHGLAGIATDRQGDQLVFAVVADRVKPANDYYAQLTLDKLAAALSNCSCGSG